TYLYNVGDGLDTLTDYAGQDTVAFGTGFSFENTVIRTEGGIAHLRFLDSDGTEGGEGVDIALNADGTSPVETFAFADGGAYTLDDLLIRRQTHYGTTRADAITTGRHDDTIYAGNGTDTVHSGSGHDALYGDNGNDALYGEGGNDRLFGGNGDDLLNGGAGNDTHEGGHGHNTLIGGKGDDTILLALGENTIRFDLGDGRDTLTTQGEEVEDNDLEFGAGIAQENLWFSRSGNDLQIDVLGTTDRLTFQNWYTAGHKPLEEIRTANGYELEDKQIELLVQAMAAFSPIPGSGNVLPAEMPDSLQPVLAAAWES
ncbi:MAG: calcium-binding protein, partial [Gammaproteobacteria bacterium]